MIRVIENSGCHDVYSPKQIKMDKKGSISFLEKIRAMSGRGAWVSLGWYWIYFAFFMLYLFPSDSIEPDARVLFIGISLFRVSKIHSNPGFFGE